MSAFRRVAALAWLVATTVSPAGAQDVAGLAIDLVRVEGRGRHVVWVSAVDADGRAVEGIGGAFSATVDGREAGAVTATAWRQLHTRLDLTVLVDAPLLGPESSAAIEELLRTLAADLDGRDRIRVVGVGGSERSREASVAEVSKLYGQWGALATSGPPRVWDALASAVGRASRLPGSTGGAVMVVTHGVDEDSRKGPIESLALARGSGRLVPVLVLLVEESGAAPEADKFDGLSARTGGAVSRVTSADAIASAGAVLLPRATGRWRLSFDAPGWDAAAPKHALRIGVNGAQGPRIAEVEYDAREVRGRSWWMGPAPWLLIGVVIALGLAGVFLTRRRQLGLLVVEGGPEDGVWYELFAYPVTIGGATGNDLVFDDPQVSRNHAVLERRGRDVEIVDLNSENGTFVNGERVVRRVLADRDRVGLGHAVELTYEART